MNETLRKEMVRKSIHVAGLAYIPLLFYLGKDLTAFLVILTTLTAIIFELIRRKRSFPFNHLLRDYEKRRIPGYIYTGMAFSLITPFFSTNACIVSAITAFVGDGVAGVVKRIKPGLSIPAFILPSLALIFIFPLNLVSSSISVIIASLLDGRKWEDNFTIPAVTAITYETLTLLF